MITFGVEVELTVWKDPLFAAPVVGLNGAER
jgi:hypothetical protein